MAGEGDEKQSHIKYRCYRHLLSQGMWASSSSLAKNPPAEATEKINDFLFNSFHSLLSRRALFPLSFRLIKITVASLRNGSVTSSSHRKHMASQVAGIQWALQYGSTHKATPLPNTMPQHSLKGQEFSREGLAPSPCSLGHHNSPKASLSRPEETTTSSQLLL